MAKTKEICGGKFVYNRTENDKHIYFCDNCDNFVNFDHKVNTFPWTCKQEITIVDQVQELDNYGEFMFTILKPVRGRDITSPKGYKAKLPKTDQELIDFLKKFEDYRNEKHVKRHLRENRK